MRRPARCCAVATAIVLGGLVSLPAQNATVPAPFVTGQEFPLGVWMQDPRNAARYHAAGINLYVALAQDPTPERLALLAEAHVSLICEQDSAGLAAKASPVIVGWMHGDEPDRAPGIPAEKGGGYIPSKPPEKVQAIYRQMKAADPARPVLLNLSPGAVSSDWVQRRDRANHPEDYPRYVLGSDIVSFDLYPVTNPHPQVAGKLGLIARGVRQLVRWAGPERAVWTCLECTHISNEKIKPAPAQVRAEAWLAIIGGARGLIYFCHEFTPRLNEAAPLDDPGMLAAITALNQEIQQLAPVLATPTVSIQEITDPVPDASLVQMLVKRTGGYLYVFVVNPASTPINYTLLLKEAPQESSLEVLGENRQLKGAYSRSFSDTFEPYAVHLYRMHEE